MPFVVIEGLDGAGKSTQINLLQDYLGIKKIEYKYLHFPRTNSQFFGEMIARFLRGEFGDISTVDPYIVALLYAGDRKDAASLIETWINNGNLVLVDRYVFSNIAFQCAKLMDPEKRELLKKWILKLEYEYYNIPKPDINLFLDVPYKFTAQRLTGTRNGSEREYLNGKQDIHEANLEFQNRVREVYLQEVDSDENIKIINCSQSDNKILTPEEIFEKILTTLKTNNIL
ncbi:MAG: dTMP kinase [Bacteroidetes bacterium]|nr:dTMP kinase [Bacteroidota bacterium]